MVSNWLVGGVVDTRASEVRNHKPEIDEITPLTVANVAVQ